jgi:hypothetical protein
MGGNIECVHTGHSNNSCTFDVCNTPGPCVARPAGPASEPLEIVFFDKARGWRATSSSSDEEEAFSLKSKSIFVQNHMLLFSFFWLVIFVFLLLKLPFSFVFVLRGEGGCSVAPLCEMNTQRERESDGAFFFSLSFSFCPFLSQIPEAV